MIVAWRIHNRCVPADRDVIAEGVFGSRVDEGIARLRGDV
jgi:hypothetical protein